MRDILHGALGEARTLMDGAVSSILGANKPSEDELLSQYLNKHRGNPYEMAGFMLGRIKPGEDPLAAMKAYEQRMEAIAARRGVK